MVFLEQDLSSKYLDAQVYKLQAPSIKISTFNIRQYAIKIYFQTYLIYYCHMQLSVNSALQQAITAHRQQVIFKRLNVTIN